MAPRTRISSDVFVVPELANGPEGSAAPCATDLEFGTEEVEVAVQLHR